MDNTTSRDGATGRRALDDASQALSGATDKRTRASVVATLYEYTDALAALMAEDAPALDAALAAMAGEPGMERPVGSLRASIRKAAKDAETARRKAARAASMRLAVGADDVRGVLGDEAPPVRCPSGYSLQARGVYVEQIDMEGGTVHELVTQTPILIAGVLRHVDSALERVCVQWRAMHGGWRSEILPRSTVRDTRTIGGLGDRGVDVGADNAAHVVRWLAAQERENAGDLPVARLADRLGWVADGVYLAGRRRVCASGISEIASDPATWDDDSIEVAIPPGDGREQILDALDPRGTLDGWRRAVDPALDHPAALLGLYGSMAAALVALLPGAPNAIVDWSGSTSRGKTSTLRLAASVWGRAAKGGGLVASWDATDAAIEGVAGLLVDLPMILDDTKDAQDSRRIERVLYAYSGGAGRARARPDGMRRTTLTRGVLLSTGEAPVTSFGASAGARARTLCLRGDPFVGEGVGEVVEAMCADLLDHYGHAGPSALAWLLARPERLAALRARWAQECERWAASASGPVERRFAPVLALLVCSARLLQHAVGLPEPRCDVWGHATAAVEWGAADADRPAAALLSVWDWCVQHAVDFWGRHEEDSRTGVPRVPARGWVGAWSREKGWDRVCIIPDALRRVLAHQGHPHAEEVITAWHERGWLVGHAGDRNRTIKTTVESLKPRVYAIRREAFRALGVGDE